MFRLQSPALLGISLLLSPLLLLAGGPRHVAGTTFFNPGVMGQPMHWANGQVTYYVDQGPLSATVSNQQATAMVATAAALWNAVPTAGVNIVNGGSLNEDVSGLNIVPGTQNLSQPSDVAPSATSYPVAVIFDADGSVLDGIYGAYTSDVTNCETNGVVVVLDNINPDATISHALMILNGHCTDTDRRMQMMSYLLERAWGLVLGSVQRSSTRTPCSRATPTRRKAGRSCSRRPAPADSQAAPAFPVPAPCATTTSRP